MPDAGGGHAGGGSAAALACNWRVIRGQPFNFVGVVSVLIGSDL